MESGLYETLISNKLIIPHKEIISKKQDKFLILQPKKIPFITYPYEWSFNQLKDASLLTLKIQKFAIKHGMQLKDASAYNVQYLDGLPIFIDTLSFEKYKSGEPWKAYGQFCRHFLAPLSLMSYVSPDLSKLAISHIDGIPLDLTKKLLPRKAFLKPGIAMHISLHSRSQDKYSSVESAPPPKIHISQNSLVGLLDSLERTVSKLKVKNIDTEWADYYSFTNYDKKAFSQKRDVLGKLITKSKSKTILDFGANNGFFSRVAAELAELVISADIDPNAVEDNYHKVKQKNETKILPIKFDLVNPSPPIGWGNSERLELRERSSDVDTVLALALIHHLAISNNLPFENIFDYFSKFGKYLIIEFIPKSDSQVSKLLSTREDIFDKYNEKDFEKALKKHYSIITKTKLKGTSRSIYLAKVK